jgi:predicted nucleic acid-binding Zn ribbon protein
MSHSLRLSSDLYGVRGASCPVSTKGWGGSQGLKARSLTLALKPPSTSQVQGQDLDDIESGIVRTGEETEQAVSELTKAAANQKRARRTLFCLLTVLLLVGILVVLIITKAI